MVVPSIPSTPSKRERRQRRGEPTASESAVERLARRTTRHESWLWLLAGVVFVADAALTTYGLRNGHIELNPVAVALFRRVGVPVTVVALKSLGVAVAGVGRAVLPAPYRGVAPLCLALPWGVGVAVNVVVLL